MEKRIIIAIFCILLIFSCKQGLKNGEDKQVENSQELRSDELPHIVKINDKVFSVPSPIQSSILIKEINQPLRFELLNDVDSYNKYLTSFKQALNIGVYGTNLATLYLNDQFSLGAEYFNVIKRLSESVGLLNAVDRSMIERIEVNSNEKDSLIFILSDFFKQIDSYMLQNDEEVLGVLVITGGWIENLYLLSSLAMEIEHPKLFSRVAEQKNPLNNILELISPYCGKGNDDYDKLFEQLQELQILFEDLDVVYVYQEPTVDSVARTTTINSSTTHNISEEQLKLIYNKIKAIREWIISE